MDAKTAAQLEAEDLEDDELPSTVERADKARAEQRQAKENLERVEERERQIDQDRERLKDSIQVVHDLLRGGARTHQPITVERLPEMASFAFLSNVAEYREYRDDQAVSEPTTRTRTLDRLEDYETEFACRYRGEARENLARCVHNMVQRVFGGRIGLSNVAEYREYRDDHAVSEPTTRTHRLGDILEQNQLHMATMATGGF